MKLTCNKFLSMLLSIGASSTVLAENGIDKLIKAGSHSSMDNMKHAQYCSSIGGVDITDTMDIQIGKNTLDAVFCRVVDQNKYLTAMQYASAGTIDSDNRLEISTIDKENTLSSFTKLTNGSVSAEAANATVPMGQSWWVRGAGYFNNIVSSSISVSVNVPDFGCSAQNQKTSFSGSATLTAQVTCAPSQGRLSTKDYVNACINGSQCAQAVGTIYFR